MSANGLSEVDCSGCPVTGRCHQMAADRPVGRGHRTCCVSPQLQWSVSCSGSGETQTVVQGAVLLVDPNSYFVFCWPDPHSVTTSRCVCLAVHDAVCCLVLAVWHYLDTFDHVHLLVDCRSSLVVASGHPVAFWEIPDHLSQVWIPADAWGRRDPGVSSVHVEGKLL